MVALCTLALQEWLEEYSLGEVWEKNILAGDGTPLSFFGGTRGKGIGVDRMST